MIEEKEILKRIENFKEACRNAGVKLTHQRIEIFREVARSESHPDADTVFKGVRKRIPTVSRDTIYRTLWLLFDLGLVNTVRSTGNRIRFDGNIDPHHHFVCIGCGITLDFKCDPFNKLKIPSDVKKMGTVKATHVEFRGLCSRCSTNNKTNQKRRTNPQGG
ncbi:MAG: Fur family transcriptional regulator [bacterium]